MLKKIVLAGGNGYIGSVLADYFKDKCDEIVVLSREAKAGPRAGLRYITWDGKSKGSWVSELEDADLLVNLCGKNVNCRYTEENKKEIFSSRLVPTNLLGEVINSLQAPPKLWINFASATIYRHAEDHYQDEVNGEIGSGFSVDVCKAWEKEFWNRETPGTRKILLRVAIVFGRSDGVMPRLKNLVRFGLGGHQGTGHQYVSWIHEHDLARITEWLIVNGKDGEVYNCAAPNALQNADLMRLLRRAYGIPIGLPAPQWLLEIGAAIIGTETELILKSRWVYPQHLLDRGFEFQFPDAGAAVREILGTRL